MGHVEKVRLPTFSGRQTDFSEFRSQFRELCQGERYTPVLEMAQLRLKLPKDALAAIIGLQCPEEAWKRLEELYGNRELSILSALKRIREFKTAKQAPHEQVIELAGAVQRCQTELKNVKALDELLNDRGKHCVYYPRATSHCQGQVVRLRCSRRRSSESGAPPEVDRVSASNCSEDPARRNGCSTPNRDKSD